MALVNCKHCGQQVSEKAAICPHCGEQLKTAICLECGNEITDGSKVCPSCGCPIDTKRARAVKTAKETVAKRKPVIIAAVFLAVFLVGFLYFRGNVLTGDNKIAYELIYDVAQSFKNPSSVRLVSGTLGVDKDCMFCGISATNGYGARSTSYYFVMDGWALEEEDDISSLYKEKDGLNFDLINKMLAKTLNVND